jgi:signal transduction histidine kinase
VRSVGFLERVPAAERLAFERRTGRPITQLSRGGLSPAPERAVYFPVRLFAGKAKHRKPATGFDGSTDPTRRAAMNEAARTHQPVATPPLRTAGGRWQPVVYDAVFAKDGTLSGFVAGSIDSLVLVRSATRSFPGDARVRVSDAGLTVFAMPGRYEHVPRSYVTVGGRRWMVEVTSAAAMGPATNLRWAVALTGLALLLTLVAFFRRALRQTRDAELLVQRRTRELEQRTGELDAALHDADTARAALSERNESLLELDRFKDRVLAMVSHDLRSPLTSVRGYVELLLDEDTGPLAEDQRRFLEIVKRNADRLDRQIGDLLLVASIAEGRLSLLRGPVNLSHLVTDAAEAAAPQAAQRAIELEVSCGELPTLDADGPRLAQVLDNLISNAIKYTPDGGRVQVDASAHQDRVTIAVRDTGIGMRAEERANVFEPFFRTEDVKERGIKGTGLGLVIVKAFVEAHEGSVSVESEPGVGSCFTIELPVRIRTPWMPPERLTTLKS